MARRSTILAAGIVVMLAGSALAKPGPAPNATLAAAARLAGDPVHGQKLYAACMGCHAIDENDVGPKHRGLLGRKAGSVAGYAYSPALKASRIIWTTALLDRWLQGPPRLVPGTKMFFSVAKPQDRADIIAFLATQK